ncbi:MAG: YraN family protein [Leptospirales bacterium]
MRYGRYDPEHFRHPGEARALKYLEGLGHILLRHNYHARFGEIDLITCVPAEDYCLHAVEVKAWNTRKQQASPFVHPLNAMTPRKQAKMRRAMESFRMHATRDFENPIALRSTAVDEDAALKRRVVDEPAWILADAGCRSAIVDLDVSFDLLWISGDVNEAEGCEFFTNLF